MSLGGRQETNGESVDLGIDGIGEATKVGQGGFGVVYRARQEAFGRTVAVKVLSVPALDEESLRRFERECRAMGSVSGHPHIVAVYGSGHTRSGQPYLVMEHLLGGSLAQLIADDGALPWEEVADAGVKLAGALASAHAAGVLHRDVKPDNVLVSAYAEPQLSDFGVARIQGGTETRTGVITGSLAHAAPEVLSGRPATEASDVYSLASTLYTLLAGTAPFVRADDETFHPLLTRIMSEDPPDLRPLGVPDELCDVLDEALVKDPDARIPSARALGEALQEVQAAHGRQPTTLVAPSADDGTATLPVFAARPIKPVPPPPSPLAADGDGASGTVPLIGRRAQARSDSASATLPVFAARAAPPPEPMAPKPEVDETASPVRRLPSAAATPGGDATTYRRDRPWPEVEPMSAAEDGEEDEPGPRSRWRRWPAPAAGLVGAAARPPRGPEAEPLEYDGEPDDDERSTFDDEPAGFDLPSPSSPAATAGVESETVYRERPWSPVAPPPGSPAAPAAPDRRRLPGSRSPRSPAAVASAAPAPEPARDRSWTHATPPSGPPAAPVSQERSWAPPPPSPSPPPAPYDPGPPGRGGSSHVWLAVLASAVVVIVAAVALFVVLGKSDTPTDVGSGGGQAPTTVGPGPTITVPGGPVDTAPNFPPGGGSPSPPGDTTPPTAPPGTAPPDTAPPGNQQPETITFVQPSGGEVGRCYVVRGAAGLRPGRSLAVGVRNLSGGSTDYATVTDWDGAGNFSRPATFGSDDNVGDSYQVTFVVFDSGSAPAGGQQIAATQVTRVAGAGDC